MLQVYSSNVDVAANTPYPFEYTVIDKGPAESLSGASTIQLNQRGVYLVEADGYATASAATPVEVQLYVNGVAQPQAISSFTTDIANVGNFGFKTFVKVFQNNCNNCCLSGPTSLQLINGATAVEDAHINVVITKIC